MKHCKLYLSIFVLLGLLAVGSINAKLIDVAWRGFGVDSAGRIYVGHHSSIYIYEKKEKVAELELPDFGDYLLTTTPGGHLLVAADAAKYTYDLEGNLLSKEPDTSGKFYDQLKDRNFAIVNGDKYSENQFLGFVWITAENGEVVYTRGLSETLAVFFLYVVSPVCLPIFIYFFIKTTGIERIKSGGLHMLFLRFRKIYLTLKKKWAEKHPPPVRPGHCRERRGVPYFFEKIPIFLEGTTLAVVRQRNVADSPNP